MKKLIVGNWKMNGARDDARALIANIVNKLAVNEEIFDRANVVVCPPVIHLSDVRHALYGFPKIKFGAQDCSIGDEGAYTGDVSAKMLQDASCSYVIVGHSERRQYHGESNAMVLQKAEHALNNDIIPIICVGETQEERDAGAAQDIVGEQVKSCVPDFNQFQQIVIAYEPVWAIGTGKTASPADAQEMHSFIRSTLNEVGVAAEKVPLLYGGSMKPDNAKDLLAQGDIDGGLIGGASLKAEDFIAIARAS